MMELMLAVMLTTNVFMVTLAILMEQIILQTTVYTVMQELGQPKHREQTVEYVKLVTEQVHVRSNPQMILIVER